MTDQKHYPMPSLTEQERKLVADLINGDTMSMTADDEEKAMRLRDSITLAALSSEPAAYSYRYAGYETCDGFQDWRDELSNERPPEWMIETGKVAELQCLHTAPPVPALKPVVLPDVGFKAVITEINGKQAPAMKLVKGGKYLHRGRVRSLLLDLGYEVKDAE